MHQIQDIWDVFCFCFVFSEWPYIKTGKRLNITYKHSQGYKCCPKGCASVTNVPMNIFQKIFSHLSADAAEQTVTWHLKLRTVIAGISITQTLTRKIMIQTVKRVPHWEENYNSLSQVCTDRALAFQYPCSHLTTRETLGTWVGSSSALFI